MAGRLCLQSFNELNVCVAWACTVRLLQEINAKAGCASTGQLIHAHRVAAVGAPREVQRCDALAVALWHVSNHDAQRAQHGERAGGGRVQVRAHVVLQLVIRDHVGIAVCVVVCVFACARGGRYTWCSSLWYGITLGLLCA